MYQTTIDFTLENACILTFRYYGEIKQCVQLCEFSLNTLKFYIFENVFKF